MSELSTRSHTLLRTVVAMVLFATTGSMVAADLPDFTKLVEDNSSAVVNISTVARKPPPPTGRGQAPREGDLEDFFRFFRPQPPSGRPRASLGSGFIISKDGFILTNNHVVDEASEIVVRLSDRRELTAELIGVDPTSDLAVLKVETDEDLPVLRIGKSSRLKVGAWVLAIGSPFGFDHSVTAGIVSAKGRSLPNEQRENYVPYIQTDVAINPGNSGGPLFNLDGEVVGINSQIYSNSGGFMGVSFAIPIDVAMEVVDQLRETGRVSRGWLGVMIQQVTRDLAEGFGLDRPHGALINQVMEGSPAQVGGLLEGDIITHFNGNAIDSSVDLPHFVGRVRAGQEAALTILRGGKEMQLKLRIGELPDDLASRQPTSIEPTGSNRLGLVVQDLTDEERSRLDIQGGARVVESNESALQAGVRPGDVITRLNNVAVDDVAGLEKIAEGLTAGRTYPVLVLRNGTPVFLPLRVPE